MISLVSCRLYSLDPDNTNVFYATLKKLQEEESEAYGEIPEIEESLSMYYEEETGNDFGVFHHLVMDRSISVWDKEKGQHPVRVSIPVKFQIYTKGGFENHVGIFASRYDSLDFRNAMRSLCDTEEHVFRFVSFDLKGDVIKDNFSEIKRFAAEKLMDDREKKASIGGIELQQSSAWSRYVNNLEGKLIRVVVKINDVYVTLAEDGMVRFRSQGSVNNDISFSVEIFRRIQGLDMILTPD